MPMGMQVACAEQYEKHLNAKIKKAADKTRIKFISTSFDRLLKILEAGRGDIAAGLLTITPEQE